MSEANGERPINISYQISHRALSFKKHLLKSYHLIEWLALKNTYV
jgi:hypothetical protein